MSEIEVFTDFPDDDDPFFVGCLHCRFWERTDDGDGECRVGRPMAHAVTRVDGIPAAIGLWPETSSSDWCGEFKSSRGAEPTPFPPAAVARVAA